MTTHAVFPAMPAAARPPDVLCRLCEAAAVRVFGVTSASLRSASRCSSRIAFARQTAMYLANVAFGLGYARVGAGFGRDRTTVRHACAKIEDARDCASFDAGLCVLEAALCQHADYCAQLFASGPACGREFHIIQA